MTASRVSYEVQVYNIDHWVLDRCFRAEAEARAHGKRLFTNPRCEGYRIVRDWQKPGGSHFETELISEFRPVSAVMAVTPIEEAPVCTTDSQYYGIESRLAVGRLLRSYCERAVVTPNEFLHNYVELKRLLDREDLIGIALSRVASLQAGRTGSANSASGAGARRDDLAQAVARIAERARAAAACDLPALAPDGFGAVCERLGRQVAPEDVDFFCKVVLARELVQMRNWLFKLDFLMDMVASVPSAGAPLAILDGACADVLAMPPVLPALLGPHRTLIEGVLQSLDLCQGRLDTGGLSAEQRLVRLNATLAGPSLVDCRTALFDQIRRQIKGTQPLTFEDGAAEVECFGRLAARLTQADGVLGGGAMAEALAFRYGRFLEAGGAAGRRLAIAGVVAQYSDAKDRVRFLVTLADSDLGRQHAADIAAQLADLLGQSQDARPFISGDAPLTVELEQVTGLHRLAGTSALAEPERDRLADTIDTLLAHYIANHQVVARLDNPDEPLHERANRLVRLCVPGVLRSPKALETVRGLVIAHLRQPGFEQRFSEGLADPAARQQALRDFYHLLNEAGFR